MNSTPLDFTVYRRQATEDPPVAGIVCTHYRDQPTDIEMTDAIRQQVLAKPQLDRIHVYDGPYSIGAIYEMPRLDPALQHLFVHYHCEYHPLRLGPGWVMIFELHTGKLLYDGGDGME